jgi:hypothetical protein
MQFAAGKSSRISWLDEIKGISPVRMGETTSENAKRLLRI